MTLPLQRIDDHALVAPTADDFRSALRVLDPRSFDQLWTELCREAGLPRGCYLLEVAELEALAAAVTARPGAVGLIGRDLGVRVASYHALSGRASSSAAGARDWGRAALETLLRGRPERVSRIREVADLDLFSDEARVVLDKAAKEAAERFGTPIGLVSIVLQGSQVFAGAHGLQGWIRDVRGTPVEWSLCATTLRTREPYLVPEARANVLQRTNPLVEHHGLVSYAGVPLITSSGQVLGTQCLLSDTPRAYSDEEIDELQGMADRLVAELERAHRSAGPIASGRETAG